MSKWNIGDVVIGKKGRGADGRKRYYTPPSIVVGYYDQSVSLASVMGRLHFDDLVMDDDLEKFELPAYMAQDFAEAFHTLADPIIENLERLAAEDTT